MLHKNRIYSTCALDHAQIDDMMLNEMIGPAWLMM